jgi:hypothetical protein
MRGDIPPLPSTLSWRGAQLKRSRETTVLLPYALNLILWSSLTVRDQVLHPYKMTGKIVVLCNVMFRFVDGRRKIQKLKRMAVSIHEFSLLSFSWVTNSMEQSLP